MIDEVLLRARLTLDEAKKMKAYPDTRGKITIGIGHNLTDKGISEAVCTMLYAEDSNEAKEAAAHYPWFAGLDQARAMIVVCMIFNMGAETFAEFHDTIAAFAAHDWVSASQHMLASKWAQQVGNRAVIYARIVRTGIWE